MIVLAMIGYLLSRPAINEGALEQTHQAILSQPFSCPVGTVEELKRWYLDGYVRRCIDDNKQVQGPMIGWRSAHAVVSGQYRDGHRDGDWVWYNAKGEVARTKRYQEGDNTDENKVGNQ